jgi:hypothetical protein
VEFCGGSFTRLSLVNQELASLCIYVCATDITRDVACTGRGKARKILPVVVCAQQVAIPGAIDLSGEQRARCTRIVLTDAEFRWDVCVLSQHEVDGTQANGHGEELLMKHGEGQGIGTQITWDEAG